MPSLIVVPTYNEVENLGALLTRVGEETPEAHVLVVDDNSPDGTRNVVKNFQRQDPRVHLLERPGKQGLGPAYLAGMRWGIDHGYDKIVQMDADFSHDPSYLPKFLRTLDEADVVMGSRYAPGGTTENWSLLRKFISRGGNTYAKTVLGLKYTDLTGGFNGWRAKALEKLGFEAVRSRGYAFQVELKYRAHVAGLKLAEVPITVPDRRLGQSKMSSRIVFEAALRVLQLRRLVASS